MPAALLNVVASKAEARGRPRVARHAAQQALTVDPPRPHLYAIRLVAFGARLAARQPPPLAGRATKPALIAAPYLVPRDTRPGELLGPEARTDRHALRPALGHGVLPGRRVLKQKGNTRLAAAPPLPEVRASRPTSL